ncbi:MAG TPA: hypothetical protein VMQ99_22310 [Acetobacteraceae bacterium]|jgi:hypothetical protein|nr:hypothetical protein [Acetobacteraceae bacterium]
MAVIPHLAFFLERLIATLAGLWPSGSADEQRYATRITIEALDPRDVVEAMLAARMIAAHHASMSGFQRAAQPGVSEADATRLLTGAIAAGRSFDAALRLLDKHRAPAAAPRQPALEKPADKSAASRPATSTGNVFTAENPLEGFTPEEIADAEHALDNDPVELARNELAQRIPLHRYEDMTVEERRIAYAEQSDRTPAQWAVLAARMQAATRQLRERTV